MGKEILNKLYNANAPQGLIDMVSVYMDIAEKKIYEQQLKQYEHTIMFVPICGNCGTLITDTVDVNRDEYGYSVEPHFCRQCGTYFKSTVMPAKFPFEGYFKEGEHDV